MLITIPQEVRAVLEMGGTIALSTSGGKDSQAMINATVEALAPWHAQLIAIHADLGRAEWSETAAHVAHIAQAVSLPLVVVQRPKGDLVTRFEERRDTLAGTGKPFWPSSAARYCTSDLKRGPIDTYLRQYTAVVSAEGVRGAESSSRAKKAVVERREQICTQSRIAYNWRPIHHFSTEDVWSACGTSSADLARRQRLYQAGHQAEALHDWPAHPAYVYGNERLSCALCILGSKNDLRNGARHNPALYQQYVQMEQATGFSFRADFALGDLFAEAATQQLTLF